MIPVTIYTKLGELEWILILLLILSILIKKRWLALILITLKIFIHCLVLYELYQAMTHPFIKETLILYVLPFFRQIICILILLMISYFQIRKEFKKVCIAMGILLVTDLVFTFVCYPAYTDFFMNDCSFCNRDVVKILFTEKVPSVTSGSFLRRKVSFWNLLIISSAPFYSGSLRISATFIEFLCFMIQYQGYRKKFNK